MVQVGPPGWGAASPRVGEAFHVVPPGWGATSPRVGEALHVLTILSGALCCIRERGDERRAENGKTFERGNYRILGSDMKICIHQNLISHHFHFRHMNFHF